MTGAVPIEDYENDPFRFVDYEGKEKHYPKDRKDKPPLILSSRDFIGGFCPPDYLLEGILQRRFIYSLTAPTGGGKTSILMLLAAHTANGTAIGAREIVQGRVIYFAGENPDDVRMRWIVMAEQMNFDIDTIPVHFIPGTFDFKSMSRRIHEEADRLGGFSLAIIDTSAAYFRGSDENSNVEMGKHARQMREFTTLPGAPCVVVACHPVKNASNENLLPRGGGSFIAEVDGNLVGQKHDSIVDLHWQGKFRGPDFQPLAFKLETVTSDRLTDSKDRRIPTVIARPLTEIDRSDINAVVQKHEDQLLLLLVKGPCMSIAGMAEALGWLSFKGEPQKSTVARALDKLRQHKLVAKERNRWELTPKGKEEAKKIEANTVQGPQFDN